MAMNLPEFEEILAQLKFILLLLLEVKLIEIITELHSLLFGNYQCSFLYTQIFLV